MVDAERAKKKLPSLLVGDCITVWKVNILTFIGINPSNDLLHEDIAEHTKLHNAKHHSVTTRARINKQKC